MSHAPEYLVLQYVSNPLRAEGRNVGIVVRKGVHCLGRFVGETGRGLDRRRLKSFNAPDVYEQWVNHWRNCLAGDFQEDPFKAILDSQQSNYRAFVGGEVGDTGADPLEDVLEYLYTVLVSDEGFAGVLASEEDAIVHAEHGVARVGGTLDQDLVEAFRGANILASEVEDSLALVPYPVRRRAVIRGKTGVSHRPEFSQQNGRLVVMESVDFTIMQKDRARDHAGLTGYVFQDVREEGRESIEAVAIVRVRPEDQEHGSVRYGLSILSEAATRIVNWESEEAETFVEERRRMAFGA